MGFCTCLCIVFLHLFLSDVENQVQSAVRLLLDACFIWYTIFPVRAQTLFKMPFNDTTMLSIIINKVKRKLHLIKNEFQIQSFYIFG